jgi:sugar phosphate isomerase/epimerase
LQAIQATGYEGPVSVEVFSDDLRKLPPEQAAKKAGEATRNVARIAGIVSGSTGLS